jgi:hypothetical protein
MARVWTQEQKAVQAAAIRTWEPWKQSTGPQSMQGKAKSSRNAYKGSVRPFERLIARTTKVLSNPSAMTNKKANSIIAELCRLSDLK